MIDSTLARILVLSVLLGFIGCSRDKPAESATSYEDGPESGMTPASGSVTTDEAAAASSLGANSIESLSDPQIAAIAGAINNAEVERAKIAENKAKTAPVKRFAETMIAHHSQAVKDVDEFETKAALEPKDSRLLAELRVEAKGTEDKLDQADAASFDKLYMMTEVDAHRKALDTFDGRLLSNAKDPELKQLLQGERPRIASHLEMARAILSTL